MGDVSMCLLILQDCFSGPAPFCLFVIVWTLCTPFIILEHGPFESDSKSRGHYNLLNFCDLFFLLSDSSPGCYQRKKWKASLGLVLVPFPTSTFPFIHTKAPWPSTLKIFQSCFRVNGSSDDFTVIIHGDIPRVTCRWLNQRRHIRPTELQREFWSVIHILVVRYTDSRKLSSGVRKRYYRSPTT